MDKLRKAMRSPNRSSSPSNSIQDRNEAVKVCVRLKSTSAYGLGRTLNSDSSPWNFDSTVYPNLVTLDAQYVEKFRKLSFSHGYDLALTGTDNTEVYQTIARDIVNSAMDGFHGTEDEPGVIPQAVDDIFKYIKRAGGSKEFLLRVSYMEIYNETIRDLLATESVELKIHEDKYRGVYVAPLKEEIVTNPKQVMKIIDRGEANRHVSANDYHEHSSRSHTVFQVIIESSENQSALSSLTPKRRGLGLHKKSPSQSGVKLSYLNLIDLAGSEKFTTNLDRRKEAAFINKSLLTLGAVISKIAEGKTGHIPFRDSKLTRVLQTTLSGNCRIGVICTINEAGIHVDESINTLKFGARVKKISTKAQRNQVVDDKALLQKYLNEITILKAKLTAPTADQEVESLRIQNQKYEEEVMELHLARTTYKERIDHLTKLILTSSSMGDKIFKRSRPMSVHIGHRNTASLNPRLSFLGKHRDKSERLEWALGDLKFKNRYIQELEGLLTSLSGEDASSPMKIYERYLEIQNLKETWDEDSQQQNVQKNKAMEEKVTSTLGRVASLRLSRQFVTLDPPAQQPKIEMAIQAPPQSFPQGDNVKEMEDLIEEQNKVILELEQERKYQTKLISDLKDKLHQIELQQFRRAEHAAATSSSDLQRRVAELEATLDSEREWRKKYLHAQSPASSAPISPVPPPRLRPPRLSAHDLDENELMAPNLSSNSAEVSPSNHIALNDK